ncbi:MAG: hypothetical protein GXP48_10440 [Acidobacteria bacterium]|nr:hypothetical protein [Acidobacteriota bacterium]
MHRIRFESGQINVGCFIALIVLAVAVVVAIKTIPVVISMGDMEKEIEALAARANIPTYTNSVIRGRILQKAQSLDLPVGPKNIRIERNSQYIRIVVTYDLAIKYPFYTYHWHKVHDFTSRLF